jgi:hypothetical protein
LAVGRAKSVGSGFPVEAWEACEAEVDPPARRARAADAAARAAVERDRDISP